MRHQPSIKSTKLSLHSTKAGFTIIELTLTMSFVAVLLITIAIVTTNIVTIYQKGLALKAVNSVGRSLIDELTTAISSAPAMDINRLCQAYTKSTDETYMKNCLNDDGQLYVYQEYTGPAKASLKLERAGNVQYGGVFCTGRYSYVWNTYYGLQSNRTISVKYHDRDSGSNVTLVGERLLRFEDSNHRLCTAATDLEYKSSLVPGAVGTLTIDMTQKVSSGAMVDYPIPAPTGGILNEFDLDLVLYELTLFRRSQDNLAHRIFMAGSFILATERGNVDITRSGDYCNTNDRNRYASADQEDSGNIFDIGAEYNYCAINKFNFASRTAGV